MTLRKTLSLFYENELFHLQSILFQIGLNFEKREEVLARIEQ